MKTYFILLLAMLSVTLYSCKKDKDSIPSNNNPVNTAITPSTTNKLSATINGTSINWVQNQNNMTAILSYSANLLPYPATNYIIYSSGMGDFDSGLPAVEISKGTLSFVGNPPDSSVFRPFFLSGNYNYSLDAANGIKIDYWEVDGHHWSTSLGSGNQAGRSFKIEEMVYYLYLGDNQAKVRLTFDCTLYDSTGTSINLLNGSAIVPFGD